MNNWRKTGVLRSSCEGMDGVCPNLADWTKEDVGLCNDCKTFLQTGPLPPLAWQNLDCPDSCETKKCETPVATHADILILLESGWPICLECGSDMIPVEN